MLLALALVLAACDGVSTPPREVVLTATVSGTDGGDGSMDARIGALLLSIDGVVDHVASTEGRVLLLPESDETVMALVLTVPRTTTTFRMTVLEGVTPAVRVLEVSDGANSLRPDPGAFTVEIRAEGDGS